MPAVHRPAETLTRFLQCFEQRPVSRADAARHGFTRGQLDAAVRRGLLVSPKYGLLQAADGPDASSRLREPGPDPDAEHLAQIRATLVSVRDEVLVAGDSAAIVQGIARPSPVAPPEVLLIRPDGSGYGGSSTRRRGSPVPDSQRVIVDGIPVTSVERTAVDVARGRHLPAALISLDSAARIIVARETGATGNRLRECVLIDDLHELARTRLHEALLSIRGWKGTVRVRDALAHMHPASESAHESRSRGWFVEAGLGPLNPGTPIPCGGSTYWADFCDIERRVIGEADGWSKYGRTPESIKKALDAERHRQAELELDGWRFARWSTSVGRASVVHRMSRLLNSPRS
ncbi:MAG: hypothetical protein U0R68_07690 [Candidatus Nanopelagicales bacterium]